MRAVRKARTRRSSSPDQFLYAFRSALTLLSCTSYRFCTSFPKQGNPALFIAVLLDDESADDAVAHLLREFEEFDDVKVFATHSAESFLALCSNDCHNSIEAVDGAEDQSGGDADDGDVAAGRAYANSIERQVSCLQ